MNLTEVKPYDQPPSPQRALAKLARIARADTMSGGARALRLMRRLEISKVADYNQVVSEVYGQSNGTTCGHAFFKCPECGTVVYGDEEAYEHCDDFFNPCENPEDM